MLNCTDSFSIVLGKKPLLIVVQMGCFIFCFDFIVERKLMAGLFVFNIKPFCGKLDH